jgi:hypothetical protein
MTPNQEQQKERARAEAEHHLKNGSVNKMYPDYFNNAPDVDKMGRHKVIQEGPLKGEPNMMYEYPNNEDQAAVKRALGK